MPTEERALLEGCLRGEPAAWARLVETYGMLMRRAAAARLGNDADAEEVCQRVLVKLSVEGGRALRTYRGDCRLGTWLVAVTLREALDHLRAGERRDRLSAGGGNPPKEVPSPLLEVLRREDAARLHEAMAGLPPRDRLILRLHYWDGVPHAETARVLGVSLHSVTTLLGRAQERLKRALEQRVDSA